MEAILKVKKAELLKKLEDRLEEIKTSDNDNHYIKEIDQALELLKNGETPATFKARLITHYEGIVAGLKDGTIGVTNGGRLSNAPATPKPNTVIVNYRGWDKEALLRQRQQYEDRMKARLKPVQAEIDLLKMAAGQWVEIESKSYQKLLTGYSW